MEKGMLQVLTRGKLCNWNRTAYSKQKKLQFCSQHFCDVKFFRCPNSKCIGFYGTSQFFHLIWIKAHLTSSTHSSKLNTFVSSHIIHIHIPIACIDSPIESNYIAAIEISVNIICPTDFFSYSSFVANQRGAKVRLVE